MHGSPALSTPVSANVRPSRAGASTPRRHPPWDTRLLLAVVCSFLLVVSGVPIGSSQVEEEPVEEIERAYRITNGGSDPLQRFEAFDAGTVAAFDFDSDGVKEIVAHNDNNYLYVFDGATGRMVTEIKTEHPHEWDARELAGPGVGDTDGDGIMEIVATNSAGWLTVIEVTPSEEPGGPLEFETLWEKWMDPREEDPDYLRNHPWAEFHGHPGLDGSAYLADASGDGRDEIFLQLDDMPGMYALDGDGETQWWRNWTDGNANPVATDFTGDGEIEVAYPADGGRISMIDGTHLNGRCSIDLRDHGPKPAAISVAPTAADLTGDGRKELVFGVRQAVEDEDNPEWFLEQNAHFFAVDADCNVVWHQTWEWANPHVYMHPVPVDVDGDGRLDVVFQDWNTIGHKPGDWQPTGEANLFAVDGATGRLLWHRETESPWSNKNLAVGDVTRDGDEEILVVEARGGQDGIMVYDLAGNRKEFFPVSSGWSITRGPSAIDLDGDGFLEILVPVHKEASGCDRDLDVGCREGAFEVFRTPGSGEPTWPNVKTYNDRFDDQGGALMPPAPDVDVEQVDSEEGELALKVDGEDVRAAHVRVPGTGSWQRLEAAGNDSYSSRLAFLPFQGDEVQVRLFTGEGRVGIVTFEADSPSTMLEVALRSDRDLEGAYVTVEGDNGTVWEGEATPDGRIRVPVEPGTYVVEASAPGHRSSSTEVEVDEEGITKATLAMEPSLWALWLGLGGALALTGVVAGGVVVKRRRGRRPE